MDNQTIFFFGLTGMDNCYQCPGLDIINKLMSWDLFRKARLAFELWTIKQSTSRWETGNFNLSDLHHLSLIHTCTVVLLSIILVSLKKALQSMQGSPALTCINNRKSTKKVSHKILIIFHYCLSIVSYKDMLNSSWVAFPNPTFL